MAFQGVSEKNQGRLRQFERSLRTFQRALETIKRVSMGFGCTSKGFLWGSGASQGDSVHAMDILEAKTGIRAFQRVSRKFQSVSWDISVGFQAISEGRFRGASLTLGLL